MMKWLGLDVGGANLKAADGHEFARSLAFPLWKQPECLSDALRNIIQDAPRTDGLAVTMTGELADCFETKIEGVLHILDAVESAASSRRIVVYFVDGRLVELSSARSEPSLAAASNWHALARFATRYVSQFPAILVDIGSTTTDVVPLNANGPSTQSRTDTERLLNRELAYVGMTRTPIAAVTNNLPYRGRDCPVAAEYFATTADSAVLVGFIPEDPDDCNTADGRPLTMQFARDRMARTICADRHSFDEADALTAAQFVWNRQVETIAAALQHVARDLPTPPETTIVSGSGGSLAEAAIESANLRTTIVRLSDSIGADASSVAPAHSVAVLASEEGFTK